MMIDTLRGLSSQHLNAHLAKLSDRVRELDKEKKGCQGIVDKILAIKEERRVQEFGKQQMSLFR